MSFTTSSSWISSALTIGSSETFGCIPIGVVSIKISASDMHLDISEISDELTFDIKLDASKSLARFSAFLRFLFKILTSSAPYLAK